MRTRTPNGEDSLRDSSQVPALPLAEKGEQENRREKRRRADFGSWVLFEQQIQRRGLLHYLKNGLARLLDRGGE